MCLCEAEVSSGSSIAANALLDFNPIGVENMILNACYSNGLT